jgi:uridine phosphorylase
VAQFRGVSFGQMLYAGDDLSGEAWDGRGWLHHESGRDVLLRLAAEAVLRIEVTDEPSEDSRRQHEP